jgi:hypothetical protein
MGSPFPSDSDHRSKLIVAQSCLRSILPQLTESDRVSIIQFDDRQDLLFPLQHITEANIRAIEDILSKLLSRGGTNLGAGIASGFKHLSEALDITPPASQITDIRQQRTKRVVFMTDMESTASDETVVIKLAQDAVKGVISAAPVPVRNLFAPSIATVPLTSSTPSSDLSSSLIASNAIFTSIIGIGVDLSVHTVERICAIPGARYISAINASEFMSTVADEFPYDISPLAFNIRINFPPQVTVNKIYGASELNSIPSGSTSFTISSEFANPLEQIAREGAGTSPDEISFQRKGGILLIQLNEIGQTALPVAVSSPAVARRRSTRKSNTTTETTSPLPSLLSSSVPPNHIHVQWTDLQNLEQECFLPFVVPPPLPLIDDENTISSLDCDEGLIKAVVLMTYVDHLDKYATNPPKPCFPLHFSEQEQESLNTLLELPFHDILVLPSLTDSPAFASLPKRLIVSHQTLKQFQNLKSYFLNSCHRLGDETIFTKNQNILQTIQQVIELESKEFQSDYEELSRRFGTHGKKKGKRESHGEDNQERDCPYSYLCPITLTMMKEPVIACDGHSYEKESIMKWFETKQTSPVTNLPLPNQMLIENHTLKSAIEEFLSKTNEEDQTLQEDEAHVRFSDDHKSPRGRLGGGRKRGRGK